MTGRRHLSRFSIRFSLILITGIGLLLATHSHYRTKGSRREIAADSMLKLGVAPFPMNYSLTFQDYTFPGSSSGLENATKITMPIVAHREPGSVEKFGRRLLGNQIFTDYGSLLVQLPIEEDSELFIKQLNDLQSVKIIYYHPNTLDDELVSKIKKHRPAIELASLEGKAYRDANGNLQFVR